MRLRKSNNWTFCETNIDHNSKTNRDDEEINSKSNSVIVAAVTYLPKDNPAKPRGEDAHFICKHRSTIGVADGVGGWAKKGIDSGIYARKLMKNCARLLRRGRNDGINLTSVLDQAYWRTTVKGSSTACLVSVSGKILHAVNVGDSGFLVVRNGKEVRFQSPVQHKKFNHPYQLGIGSDNPSVSEEFELDVEIGDVIILGTDGLWDNMEVDEIIEEVKRGCCNGDDNMIVDLKMMSSRIANLALYNSFDGYSETPFSKSSVRAGFPFVGGKVDDITVIVAQIQAPKTPMKENVFNTMELREC